jgi:hypothetical protein
MSLPNDIDLQFRREKHGWSEARLYVDNHVYDFILTHIFDDPLESLLSATLCLANGSDLVNFSWYEEPGQYDWKFTKIKSEHHLLDVLIYEYSDIIGYYNYQNNSNKLCRQIAFKVAKNFWIELVTSEAEKISRLLSYRHYKSDRNPQSFPWQELKELKNYFK